MNSTFTPAGKTAGSTSGARVRSEPASSSPAGRAQTRCGLPTSTAAPGRVSPPRVAVAVAYSRGRRISTAMASPSTRARTTPARVATGSAAPDGVARPVSSRYRTKTRAPLPHISANEPSAFQ